MRPSRLSFLTVLSLVLALTARARANPILGPNVALKAAGGLAVRGIGGGASLIGASLEGEIKNSKNVALASKTAVNQDAFNGVGESEVPEPASLLLLGTGLLGLSLAARKVPKPKLQELTLPEGASLTASPGSHGFSWVRSRGQ